MNYYPWLDWLRFLAASMVLFGHARGFVFVPYGELDPNSQNVFTGMFFLSTRFAHLAVLVFFVISGFLVGGRLLERLKDGSFSPKAYALDRSTRIMIPLVPVLLFTALVQWSVGN
jgi:peptidoglycan/LPS O-acetylase OafA/YrhL